MTEVHLARQAAGPVDAVVEVPGSKSIANRALVCAALADGRTVLERVPGGDDTVAMLDCLERLGAGIGHDGEQATVLGMAGSLRPGPIDLPTRLAGTTSRFVTALASLGEGPYRVDGEPPLRRRPMAPLHDALRALGAGVTALDGPGRLPVDLAGPPTGHSVALSGDVSSQFLSALMLIGPYLPAGLDVELTTALISRPYVDITAAVIEAFGVPGVVVAERRVTVPHGRYRAREYTIEPDASSASYALALAAVTGGTVGVPGLSRSALQGDARFADLLGRMGCGVEWTADRVVVSGPERGALRGIDVDMADVSDLVPTLAVVAATAATPTSISGVGFIRGKESDRIGDLAAELRRTGAVVHELNDGLEVEPSPGGLHAARLGTHHDHRLAMAFGVLGAVVGGIEIEDPGVVSKSWPAYWDVLAEVLASSSPASSR